MSEPAAKRVRIPSSKYWLGTWNNYTDAEQFIDLLNGLCEKYCCQEEVGASGTPHLQFKVCFAKACRPCETIPIKEIHWEKSRKWDGWQYCAKDDTAAGKRWAKGCDPPERLEIPEMTGWQLDMLEILKQKPDHRTIYWLWEPEGNFGKSAFARYCCCTESLNATLFGGKAADAKAGLALMKKKPRICLLDVPRSVEHISYTALEEIKNGVFFSSKYESGMVKMNHPHVVVLANEPPEFRKLSSDRWKVFNLRDDLIQ